jgi:hypothetical protein
LDGQFDRRGQFEGRAVFCCGVCESYFTVKAGVLLTRTYPVPVELQVRMDDLWKAQERQGRKARRSAAAHALGKEVACPECGRHFATDRARDQHVAAKHGI